jgi:FK506-binding nuclear protein
MAAIDPSEPAELDENSSETTRPRATLKIIRQADGDDDDDNEEYMRALLADSDSESEDDSQSDEEVNGGPSDPAKSKKARKAAALKQLMESIDAGGESDEEMEHAADELNGVAKADKKGKAKATSDDEEEEDEDSDDEDLEIEEFVLCTLDPEKVSHSMRHVVVV